MTTVAFVSTKGSPGATTAALAIAHTWAATEPTMIAELDPDGGDIAAMCGLSYEDKGLFGMSIAARREGTVVNALAHCQEIGPARLPALVAPAAPSKVNQAFEFLGTRLHACLDATDHTVLIDAGRIRSSERTTTLLERVDLIVVVARPTVSQAVAIEARHQFLRSLGPKVTVLLVGDRPYGTDEFSAATQFDVVGVLPFDTRGVEALTTKPGSLSARRSLLARALPNVVDRLRERVIKHVEVSR